MTRTQHNVATVSDCSTAINRLLWTQGASLLAGTSGTALFAAGAIKTNNPAFLLGSGVSLAAGFVLASSCGRAAQGVLRNAWQSVQRPFTAATNSSLKTALIVPLLGAAIAYVTKSPAITGISMGSAWFLAQASINNTCTTAMQNGEDWLNGKFNSYPPLRTDNPWLTGKKPG